MGKGDLASASLVELKAELYKKREAFDAAKAAPTAGTKKDSMLWLKRGRKEGAAGAVAKVCVADERDAAEEQAWEKSRLALEEKAQIYAALQRGDGSQVGDTVKDNLLVDFDRKFHNEVWQPQAQEEQVEYLDEFGRTRTMGKSQFHARQREEADAMIAQAKQESEQQLAASESEPDTRAGPAHFDDSQEIRTKGVGFYRFAAEESERQKQLQGLMDLRRDTVESRTKTMIARERRRLAREARLQRVQERRAGGEHAASGSESS